MNNINNICDTNGKRGPIVKSIVVVATLLSLFLFVQVVAGIKTIGIIGEGITPANTISVSGTGNTFAIPDIATVNFDLTAFAADIPTAQNAVTTRSNAVLAYLKGQSIKDADVKTTNYSIEPHYEYQSQATVCPAVPGIAMPAGVTGSSASAPNSSATSGTTIVYCPPSGKQVLTGYDVTDSIQVTIHDISKAGTILAGLGSEKVGNLSGLSFSVENPDLVDAQARAIAIKDAQTKAGVLAGQLGVDLGRVVGFSENSGGLIYEPMAMSAAVGSGVATPQVPQVPAGQNKVTSNVTITYEIE